MYALIIAERIILASRPLKTIAFLSVVGLNTVRNDYVDKYSFVQKQSLSSLAQVIVLSCGKFLARNSTGTRDKYNKDGGIPDNNPIS